VTFTDFAGVVAVPTTIALPLRENLAPPALQNRRRPLLSTYRSPVSPEEGCVAPVAGASFSCAPYPARMIHVGGSTVLPCRSWRRHPTVVSECRALGVAELFIGGDPGSPR